MTLPVNRGALLVNDASEDAVGTFTVGMATWLSQVTSLQGDRDREGTQRQRHRDRDRETEPERDKDRHAETERHRERERDTEAKRHRETETQSHRDRDRAVHRPSRRLQILARLTLVFCRCRGLRPHGRTHKHAMMPAESLIDQRDTFSRRKKRSLQALTPGPLGRRCRLTDGKTQLCVVFLTELILHPQS